MMESTYICVTVVQEVQPRLLILLMKNICTQSRRNTCQYYRTRQKEMSNLYYGDDKYLFIGYSNKLSYIDKSNISSSVEIVPVK